MEFYSTYFQPKKIFMERNKFTNHCISYPFPLFRLHPQLFYVNIHTKNLLRKKIYPNCMREKAEKTSNSMRQERKIIQIVLSSIIYGAVESWKIFFLFLISELRRDQNASAIFCFLLLFLRKFHCGLFFTLNFFIIIIFLLFMGKRDKFHSLLLPHKFYLVVNYFPVLELMKKKR